jgi:4-amino-4-deoxy-L-arabinose transferase-like glycosyltransferase
VFADSVRALQDRRLAVCIIAIGTVAGLVLRLMFALAYWADKPLTHDEREYLALARSIASGDGVRYPPPDSPATAVERFGRAPLYPWVLSWMGGAAVLEPRPEAVPVPVRVGQSIVGAAAVPILAAIAWRAAGPAAGAVAALLTAVHPPLVRLSGYALSEGLYVTLAWLTVLVFGLAVDRRSPPAPAQAARLLAVAGLLAGLAVLTRPAMLLFVGPAALWLALRRPPVLALSFLAAAILVVAPWTIRNVREYGRFVLVASEGGITFWTGNHPMAVGDGDMAANPAIKEANLELRRRQPGLSPEALEPIYYREAFSQMAAHPVWWTGLVARKAFYLFVPVGPSYRLHSLRFRLASIVPYLALLPFAAAGALTLRRMRTPVAALALMFASVVLTALVFLPQERFRAPVIDPTLIVCAAAWVAARGSASRAAGPRD